MRNAFLDTTVGTVTGGPYSIIPSPLASPTFTGTVTTAAIICTGITNSGTDQAATVTSTGALNAGTNKFTINSSGLCTTYNSIANVSNGLAQIVATVDKTAQVATLTAQALYTPVTTGLFRLSAWAKKTLAATTSSTLGALTITFTEGTDSVSVTLTIPYNTNTGTQATTNALNAIDSTGTMNFDSVSFYAKTGVGITYTLTYASSGTTAMQYDLHMKLEAL